MEPTTPRPPTVPEPTPNDNPTLPPPTLDDVPDLLESIVDAARDLDVIADAATTYLDALPRGETARERHAVEYVARIVERIARDARYLAVRSDDVTAAIVGLLDGDDTDDEPEPAPAAEEPQP